MKRPRSFRAALAHVQAQSPDRDLSGLESITLDGPGFATRYHRSGKVERIEHAPACQCGRRATRGLQCERCYSRSVRASKRGWLPR